MSQNSQYFSFVFGPVKPILAIDICMLGVGVMGFSFNAVLLQMTWLHRKVSQAIDTTLIQILATFDALSSLFMVVSIVTRWIVGEQILTNDGTWCKVSAVMYAGATLVTLVFAALLGLARYLSIVRGWKLNTASASLAAYALVVFILTEFVYLVLRFRATVPPAGLYCQPRFWENHPSSRFVGVTSIVLLLFTLFTIPLSYLGITLYYHKVIRCMGGFNKYEHVHRIRRSTNSLILITLAYSLASFPEFLLIGLSVAHVTPRTNLLDGIAILLLSSTTTINALFALLLHDDIHRIFLTQFGLSSTFLSQPIP
ncbi:hypothetical protein DSO57_1026142 [Entomophthora muscae]|uniref:Uncharacterized protein n=2 Tax=Entomophthora muscae TaxID=34485 RepID=A0ACC2T684_9FUNG|nr:hypothetical protein DSO57_1011723 [Entomophthora muscae]KAJ9072567.1 hypothetical protein DSO57_1026142 [Entomophthora muscae]